jgi:hypothetical protein
LAALLYPDVSGNPASRLATVEALVDYGTWAIDDSQFFDATIDRVRIGDRHYSSKPPILPLIGAAAYAAVQGVTGWTLQNDLAATHTALRILLQIVPFAVFLVFFWRFLGVWMDDPRARLWLFVVTAFASYLFGYSSALNNHAPAAFCVMGAWMCGFRAARLDGNALSWLGAGVWSGLAITLDLGAGPVVGALGVYLLVLAQTPSARAGRLLPLGAIWLNWRSPATPFHLSAARPVPFRGSYGSSPRATTPWPS